MSEMSATRRQPSSSNGDFARTKAEGGEEVQCLWCNPIHNVELMGAVLTSCRRAVRGRCSSADQEDRCESQLKQHSSGGSSTRLSFKFAKKYHRSLIVTHNTPPVLRTGQRAHTLDGWTDSRLTRSANESESDLLAARFAATDGSDEETLVGITRYSS